MSVRECTFMSVSVYQCTNVCMYGCVRDCVYVACQGVWNVCACQWYVDVFCMYNCGYVGICMYASGCMCIGRWMSVCKYGMDVCQCVRS